MSADPTAFAALPDTAAIRVVAADPAFISEDDPAWLTLATGLDKLFQQFARENRVQSWAFALDAGGAAIVLAWTGLGPLSGCSHDRIAKLLLVHQERGERRLLDAPPFVVIPSDNRPRAIDRAELRRLFATGQVTAATPHYDLATTDLATWRRGPRALGDGPFALTIARWSVPDRAPGSVP